MHHTDIVMSRGMQMLFQSSLFIRVPFLCDTLIGKPKPTQVGKETVESLVLRQTHVKSKQFKLRRKP